MLILARPQILYDTPKARRETDLHFRCCLHPNIVKIVDVYENYNDNRRCLLLVMEWYEAFLLEELRMSAAKLAMFLLCLLQHARTAGNVCMDDATKVCFCS
jgi:hypothetical protein